MELKFSNLIDNLDEFESRLNKVRWRGQRGQKQLLLKSIKNKNYPYIFELIMDNLTYLNGIDPMKSTYQNKVLDIDSKSVKQLKTLYNDSYGNEFINILTDKFASVDLFEKYDNNTTVIEGIKKLLPEFG